MRTIYIDVLITVNIFVDFFLILCTKACMHIKLPLRKIIFGSIAGGILSLVALLPKLDFPINIIADIFIAAVIIFVAFGKSSFKSFVKRLAVYFLISFSFCGIMIFIYSAFKPNGMAIYNDIVYFNISPIVLIILTLACYYILKLIKRLTKGVNGGGVCNIEINVCKNHFTFSAKIDTGCNVKEPFSGDYVIIAEKMLIGNYTPDERSVRVIPFDSLGGSGILKGFKPEKIIIDGTEVPNNIYIGICENIIKGDIKALVPYEIIKNCN